MTWSMLSPTVNPKHQTVGAALVTCEHDKTCSVAMCEIWGVPGFVRSAAIGKKDAVTGSSLRLAMHRVPACSARS